MRIDPNDRIAGLPVLAVQQLLRRRQSFGPADVAQALDIDGQAAERVMQALIGRNYIQPVESPGGLLWQLSVLGARFAWATTLPPITRAEADALLAESLARARAVRDDDRFLWSVRQLIVFGSYLSDADQLGDLDLVLKTRPKRSFKGDYGLALRAALDRYTAKVGRIATRQQWVRLAIDELRDHLRFSPYLSIHPHNQLEVIERADRARGIANPGTPFRIVYDDIDDTAAAPSD